MNVTSSQAGAFCGTGIFTMCPVVRHRDLLSLIRWTIEKKAASPFQENAIGSGRHLWTI